MRPEDVPDDLAYQVAEALADARWGVETVRQDPEVIEVMDADARNLLAAVLPEARTKALHEAAEFVDSQRYIDEPADLRQVRDRLHGLADGTWEAEG